ncbi:TrbI F-type domain-containing protein [Proteus sp. fly-1013]|uniref:TrbI F-type domain-containing protein n=1 Tax=Proteus sp. fly-1013 TaxID=3136673 RepID=UPI0032DAFC77
MNKLERIFLGIILIISVISSSLSVYGYLNTPKIVTFDFKSTTDTFLEQVRKLNLSEEQQQIIIKKYESNINEVIKENYTDKNITVFVQGAVIGKVDDETRNIKALLSEKMKRNNNE